MRQAMRAGDARAANWFPIRAFVVREGTIRAVDRWLRQREPLATRYR
jgi:hypothetical protein